MGTVAEIYRRNFFGGLVSHMNVQFPVTLRYIGTDGWHFVLRQLVLKVSPESPMFTLYAAQLPGFFLECDELGDQCFREALSMLAAIEFFSGNASTADQELQVPQKYYRLYTSILTMPIAPSQAQAGLYADPQWHPEVIAKQSADKVTLKASIDAE